MRGPMRRPPRGRAKPFHGSMLKNINFRRILKPSRPGRVDPCMNTKVLMVYPEIPETFWSFKHSLKFIGKKSSFPPLSLLTVAALLPERFEARIVDLNVGRLKPMDLDWADLVFVSAMLVQKDSLERVISRCKASGKTVVAGGPYPTSSYESIAGVDHFVLGEAEITLPPFIADWEAGRAGRVYRSDQRADISLTPPPRYDLIDMRPYSSMLLQYSRGCPFCCEFCEIVELFGRVPRVKRPEQFLGEVESLHSLGYRGSIFVVDDNFIGNKVEVKRLLPLLTEWQAEHGRPLQLLHGGQRRPCERRGAPRPHGGLRLQHGLRRNRDARGGFPRDHAQAAEPRDLAPRSVRRIQEKGIEVTGGFILGFDADPADVAERQISFIRESGISTAMVGLLTALPGPSYIGGFSRKAGYSASRRARTPMPSS